MTVGMAMTRVIIFLFQLHLFLPVTDAYCSNRVRRPATFGRTFSSLSKPSSIVGVWTSSSLSSSSSSSRTRDALAQRSWLSSSSNLLLLAGKKGSGNLDDAAVTHSFVEGENYEDELSAVMAMGGDPFFLINEDTTAQEQADQEEFDDVDSMGGDSFFLTKQNDDNNDKRMMKKKSSTTSSSTGTNDDTKPAFSASNIFASLGGGGGGGSSLTIPFDKVGTSSKAGVPFPRVPPPPPPPARRGGYNGEMADLDAMGGDSFFLAGNNNNDNDTGDDVDSMGGDSFFAKGTSVNDDDKQPPPPSSSSSSEPSSKDSMTRFPPPVVPKPENYDDAEMAELAAMGGDPSFLIMDPKNMESIDNRDVFVLDDPPDAVDSRTTATSISSLSAATILGSLAGVGGGSERPTPSRSPLPPHPPRRAEYDDEMAELDDMGGDTFFLRGDGSAESNAAKMNAVGVGDTGDSSSSSSFFTNDGTDGNLEERRYATDGKGPRPSRGYTAAQHQQNALEWDGTVDEEAHMDIM
jgi:hypothetical protein